MAIVFSCESCGQRFRVKEDRAGSRSKCPKCGWDITVPLGTVLAATEEAPPPLPDPDEGLVIPGLQASPDDEFEDAVIPISTIPAPSTATAPPQPPPVPSGQAEPPHSRVLPGAGFRAGLITLSLAFILAGISTGVPRMFESDYFFVHRFQADNAMGAGANALEDLARFGQRSTPAQWFILAALCWLIASVERLRYTIAIGVRKSRQE